MLFKRTIIIVIYYIITCCNIIEAETQVPLHYLKPGDVRKTAQSYRKESMEIYCYEGKPKFIVHLWQSVWLELNHKSDNFVYYEGATPDLVQQEYIEHRSSWSLNLFSWKQKSFRLDPFNSSCIGIDTREAYTVTLNVIRIDFWKVLCLTIGILLFFTADRLSKNVIFYYLCGVTFGIGASFLILIYFLSKLFPKKPMMYGVVVCGWTIGIYVLQMLWENLRTILLNYQNYVLWYAFTTGVISFIVCYRWGPVTNVRTKNLIRWTLQVLGLIAIFQSSQFQEAAMGQVVITVLIHVFPQKWLAKSRTYWKRKFPPKVKFISNAEYYQQGVKETSKALQELRQYCSSPECNQWKTVLKLSDVKRFASFVEGTSPHLSDSEMLEYETSIVDADISDDLSSDLDED